ncbi:MAG: thiosulfate oxidation carrier complex protein SoxZ [Betaproteobacteria bacterium]|nr:thiosulfate oxidation carrier complex protein SoxZ [Betaproteobacteria bacterium]
MADPMRIRVAARDGVVNVKILMSHEMETGQRKDGAGKLVSAHYISKVTATHKGQTVLSAEWGPAVAKNPFLEFNFKGGQKGDKIAVTWEDNKGESRTDETTIN